MGVIPPHVVVRMRTTNATSDEQRHLSVAQEELVVVSHSDVVEVVAVAASAISPTPYELDLPLALCAATPP